MKIALVVPPVVDFYFTPQRASFLGIHTIAGILAAGGIEYRVFNGIRGRGRKMPLPPELAYLSDYLGRQGFFKSFNRFGITDDRLAAEICDYRPDAVFINCFAFCYAGETISVINTIKKIMPGLPVVAGGAGVSVNPEYFLEYSKADCAVSGEGESVIPWLVQNLTSIKGVISGITGIGSAHESSHAAHSPILVKLRESHDTIWYSAMVTRGCPLSCSFCSVGQIFPRYKKAPLNLVDAMFADLAGKYKTIHVNFEDDNLTHDFDYLTDILDSLGRHTRGNFSFSLENGTGFRTLDDVKLGVLKQFHIKQLNLSLVSVNPLVLEENRRNYSTGQFARVAEACRELSIPVIAYLITGLPGESADSIHAGLDFLEKLPVRIAVSTFYPVPGIRGYQDRSVFNSIPTRLCAGSSFYPWNLCTTAELVSIFLRSRAITYRNALN